MLICFDFDGTMVKGHFHKLLSSEGLKYITPDTGLIINGTLGGNTKPNKEYDKQKIKLETQQLLKNSNLGVREELIKHFKDLLEDGHQIAIVSFNLYPDSIVETLSTFGLTENQLKGINIICGLPSKDMLVVGKQRHIDKAMTLVGITDPQEVILVDDDRANTMIAEKNSMKTVLVTKGINFSDKIMQKLSIAEEESESCGTEDEGEDLFAILDSEDPGSDNDFAKFPTNIVGLGIEEDFLS